MKNNALSMGALAIAVIGVLVLASVSSNPALYAQLSPQTDTATTTNGAAVAIGAGSNATVQFFTFSPQSAEINAGETVTWTSPSPYSDIHTVTFVIDQNLTSDAILPFAVPIQATVSDFELLPPFNAGEPLTIDTPDGRQAIVALNKLVWYPAVIDGSDEPTYLNGTEDIEYTLNGTEKALNSGIIVAPFAPLEENMTGAAETESTISEGLMNDTTETTTGSADSDLESELGQALPFPPVSKFAVTFNEPGTYPYFCAIHPWMGGQVIVADDNASSSPTLTP